jgi:hypothetical protein
MRKNKNKNKKINVLCLPEISDALVSDFHNKIIDVIKKYHILFNQIELTIDDYFRIPYVLNMWNYDTKGGLFEGFQIGPYTIKPYVKDNNGKIYHLLNDENKCNFYYLSD